MLAGNLQEKLGGAQLFFHFIHFLEMIFGLLVVEAGEFKIDAVGGQFDAAEPGDIETKLMQAGPFEGGVGFIDNESFGSDAVMEHEPMGKHLANGVVRGPGDQSAGVLELLEEVVGILMEEPIAVAAVFPFGDVDQIDGPGGEMTGENGLDLGQRVKPFSEGLGFFTILKTAVEFFADFVGKAGDFTGSRVRHRFRVSFEFKV